MMPTNDQLSDFLAGKIPLEEAEEIERQVRDSAALQARVANLPVDPMVDRLRKVWNRQHQNADGQPNENELTSEALIRVDRYCLLELIGTGGMGQVWKAKPVHGGSPPVALKLVKPGLDSKSILERFEVERKTLAMMDHPCIAKVLDGGSTDEGQSYFVMELVDGSSITEYCHRYQLGIDQRLRLFVQVCRAVQHAHQKGIIHRDLKPSNILVTQYDGEPLPKVIDFGLAKALGDVNVASDHSQLTEYGALIGTVRYMSPEQVDANSWDIDTRSDIYSLGVVLYELLTGSTPIQWSANGENSLLDILKSIREIEPPRPSERLSASSAFRASSPEPVDRHGLASLSRPSVPPLGSGGYVAMDCRAFRQILRRDLDWIVMKAIEKKRDRRYETADAFAQDIERYLTGQPVAARPPSAIYRLGKFVKKYRGPVTVAIALCMMTIAGIGSLVRSSQAESQKRAVYAAAAYGSIINELNLLAVSRHSGWTHRGLHLIQEAGTISTPLRDSRQLRDWAVSLLTVPDVDMTVQKRFAASISPADMTYSPSGRRLAIGLATTDDRPLTTIVLIDLDTDQKQWLTPELSQWVREVGGDPSVTSLRFGQDDNTLFVGTRNGLLLRLSLDQSPPAVQCIQASRGGVLVRLSADGRYCVTVTSRQQKLPGDHDERMRCFDAITLEQLGISEMNERIRSLTVAPDGSRISISSDDSPNTTPESIEFSLPSFTQLRTFPGSNAEYHPLGHAIFTGEHATYKRINFEKPHDAAIYLPGTTLAWTLHRIPTFQDFQVAGKGTLLTASAQAEHCIFFWREAEPFPMMSFRVSGNRNINGYALSPAMESIAVITDEGLEIYDFTDRHQYCRVFGVPARTEYFKVAPDQHEFATIAVYKFSRYSMPSTRPIVSTNAVTSKLTLDALAYHSNEPKLASSRAGADHHSLEILISDRASSTPECTIEIPDEPEERFATSKLAGLGWINQDHLVAAIDFRLMVWNTANGKLLTTMPQHNPDQSLPSYRAISILRDQCLTLLEVGTLDRWRWTGDKLIKSQPSIELNTSKAERLAWHPSGDYAIIGTQSGSIELIDLKERRVLFSDNEVHSAEICGAAWCDAHRLITASRDGKLALWRLLSGGKLELYVAWDSRSGITAIDVSADGKLYVASASESISVFDLSALDAAFAQLGIGDRALQPQGASRGLRRD